MWGPRSIAKLVYKPDFTMVYGTQITIVFMGFINQRSHHWGAHIVGCLSITSQGFISNNWKPPPWLDHLTRRHVDVLDESCTSGESSPSVHEPIFQVFSNELLFHIAMSYCGWKKSTTVFN